MNKKIRYTAFLAAICITLSLVACGQKTGSGQLEAASAPTPERTEAPLTGFLLSAKELFGDSCLIIAKTIKLTDDVTLTDDAALVLNENDAYTLDLNGRTLSAGITQTGGALISCTEGILTLMDSKGGGTISLSSSAGGAAVMCQGSGEAVVGDIKIEVAAPEGSEAFAMAVKSGGRMIINGGNFTGGTSIVVDNSQVDLTINGGSFSGFTDLGGEAGIDAFLGERKKAAHGADGSITVN